ncbi:MAG TPA: M13 family metallopeptidase [Thermomicrobiales bacterium]|nr:M13 family metallopeptidase [Thermomicrobiales bacterium]
MRSTRRSVLSSILALLFVLSLFAPATAYQRASEHGLDPRNMDLSVDPAEDFYRFANGGWLDRTEIPGDRGRYGVFNELDDLTREQLLTVLDEVANSGNLERGSDTWKAAELYRQGTDIQTRNRQGIEPIQPLLDRVDAITDLSSLHEFQQTAEFSWLTGLFFVYAYSDLQDSSVNATYLSSSFLGLPNRDYYLEDEEGNAEIREAYIATLAEFLQYGGYDETRAASAAQAVYALEERLAEPTLTQEEQQDASLSYNPMTLEELGATYPEMDWDGYMAELGLTGVDTLIVTELRYLQALDQIVKDTPIEVLKDFIKLEVYWSFADFLGEDIGQTAFEFQGGVLSGVEEQSPLEERTLDQTSGMVGEAIGQLYVAEYFPPEAKQQITTLVDSLIAAFRVRIEENAWMTDETKKVALEKLDAMAVKVGYPDTWQSYEAVEIGDSYFESFLSAVNADTRRNLEKAGKPVDRSEWPVPPQVVNAFYNPTANEIVFPAGILQAPFFDYEADAASNFGAIGAVIGHEITHGFDLQGAQFDAEGNLSNWWSEEDLAAFEELNQLVVGQYGAVEVLPGVNVDGQFTVTENVADLGGVQVAYDALEIYIAAQGDAGAVASPITSLTGSPEQELAGTPVTSPLGATPMATPVVDEVAGSPQASPVAITDFDSLTPQQRFFIAYATVWREEIRDEALQTQVQTDPHSPGQVRAVLPIQNMDEFYEAFDITEGDGMYLPPEERIIIW